ncbi:ATP-binding protein [Tardiphaga sp.]|jgi:DNA polymerase-3 subunit gamma/tau|uniref:ATP-binding protein n=1 Tax=Tardiphaga sp. TaxID=1926292 RepID=UPI0037DA4331
MVDLAAKFRPRRFKDVVGQAPLTRWMSQQIKSRERRSVLISGPYGTGKSSSAFIYAKAILCLQPKDGEACDTCDDCKDFGARGEQAPDFAYFKCGETSTIEKVQEILEFARVVPFIADRRVLLLDEAHNLSRRAFQALLEITEHPPKWTTFIIVTSEVKDLPPALVQRLTVHELTLLSSEDTSSMLAGVCQSENMPFSATAFDLMHNAVGGQPRALLRALEKVSELGAIDEANVRIALNLDFDDRLISYIEALLAGDLERQLRAIEGWPDAPSRKLRFLHQFFAYTYFNEVRRIVRDDPAMRTMPPSILKRLVDGFAEHAARLGLSIAAFWEAAMAAIEPRDAITASQLAVALSSFDRLINESPLVALEDRSRSRHASSDIARPSASGKPGRVSQRSRIGLRAADAYDDGYLDWKQVRPIWEVGSFLPQNFGVLFNLRVSLTRGQQQADRSSVVADTASDLTHELTARIRYWSPEALCHWAYRHEGQRSQVITRIILSIPDPLLPRSLGWLNAFCRKRADKNAFAWAISSRRKDTASDLVRFHWQNIRALSRGLDPTLTGRDERGEFTPLVDLLRIPHRWRSPTPVLPQSIGTSKYLTPAVRRSVAGEMPFLSAIADGAWKFVDRGWELPEFEARAAERRRRARLLEGVRAALPEEDELSAARREEELRATQASFGQDPRQAWPRSWQGWWQPDGGKMGYFACFAASKRKR